MVRGSVRTLPEDISSDRPEFAMVDRAPIPFPMICSYFVQGSHFGRIIIATAISLQIRVCTQRTGSDRQTSHCSRLFLPVGLISSGAITARTKTFLFSKAT